MKWIIVCLTVFTAIAAPVAFPAPVSSLQPDSGVDTAAAVGVASISGGTPAQAPEGGSALHADADSRSVEEGDLGGITTKTVVKGVEFDPAPTNSFDSLRNVAGVATDDAKEIGRASCRERVLNLV